MSPVLHVNLTERELGILESYLQASSDFFSSDSDDEGIVEHINDDVPGTKKVTRREMRKVLAKVGIYDDKWKWLWQLKKV